jgi:hypothetical protein
MPSKRGKGTLEIGEKIALTNMGKKVLIIYAPLWAFRPSKSLLKFSLGRRESRKGKGGWAEAVVMW